MGVLCKLSCKGVIEIVYKCIADIFYVSTQVSDLDFEVEFIA